MTSQFAQRFEALPPAKRALLMKRLQEQAPAMEPQNIAPRADHASYPLSFAQQRLWVLDQLHPESALHNIAMPIELRGPGDSAELHAALSFGLSAIVARHEALRARFVSVDGAIEQRIAPPEPLDIPLVDLCALPQAERAEAARRYVAEEAHRPIVLSRDPLLRATLLRSGDDCHLLLLVVHHIAFDAWSVGVLVGELQSCLAAHAARQAVALPALPIQYADFAAWQRAWLTGERLERQLAYWRERLANAPVPLELPISRQRPPVRSSRGARAGLAVPAPLVAALQRLSRASDATLFMTLLAAWKVLLARYTNRSDIVVGSPIANRTRPEQEPLIGYFVNTLALRTDLSGNPSFRALLERVRAATLGAYEHQDLPFELLVEALQCDRDPAYTPLFQQMFVLQNAPLQANTSRGSVRLLPDLDGPVPFDMVLSLVEEDGQILGVLSYACELFARDDVERLLRHYVALLAAIVADPDRRIEQLPLLSAAERHQILVEWNATAARHNSAAVTQPVHAIFEAIAAQMPEAPAIRYGEATLSYGELNARANRLAHYLRRCGSGPEQRVGLCARRSPEMIVGLLGVLKAGAAYVPLDPTYPAERLAYMLADARVPLIVTERALVGHLPGCEAQLLCLDDLQAALADESAENPPLRGCPANLAYMIYTSGSTGRPKGSLLSHRGLANFALDYAYRLGVGPGSNVLQFYSFGFDGTVAEVFMALLTGATLCMTDPRQPVAGVELLDLMRRYAISTTILPPALLAALNPVDLPALHTIGSAGEACSGEIAFRWGKGRRFFNIYGATEATVATTLFRAEGDCSSAPSMPVGHPMANTSTYVLDQHLQLLPVGVPGEIYIGGDGVGRGYCNRPDLTAERFVPDPFSHTPGARLYKTGDWGKLRADGALEFSTRIDDQVKVRGFRIELGEIEHALQTHELVREVVALAPTDGLGTRQLVAYVLPEPHVPPPDPAALRHFLQQQLPAHMLPSTITVLDTFPLTPNGKIDRKALAARRPQAAGAALSARPQTGLEHTIAAVWQEVLGREGIGAGDNFFDIGGNSLLLVKVQGTLQTVLEREIAMVTLFQYPTIATLAAHLNGGDEREQEAQLAAGRAQKQKLALTMQRRRVQRG